MGRTIFLLVSLFWFLYTMPGSESSVQNNCNLLKVSNDIYVRGLNGFYAPDVTLKNMYNYDKFINYTIFKHIQEDRIVFYKGSPDHWVIGRTGGLYTGYHWYENRDQDLQGPWYTNFYKNSPNNLVVACIKTGIPDSTNILRPRIMFVVVTVKILILGRLFRFVAWILFSIGGRGKPLTIF